MNPMVTTNQKHKTGAEGDKKKKNKNKNIKQTGYLNCPFYLTSY